MKYELVEVYEYSELSGDAKNRVLDRERESMSYDTWWIDDLKMIFGDMLLTKGIKCYPTEELGISFSLNHCQGDGVGFFGVLDIEELFSEIHRDIINEYFKSTLKLIEQYNETGPEYKTVLHDEITVEINRNLQGSAIIMYVDVGMTDLNDMVYTADLPGHTEEVIEQERKDFEVYLQEWFDEIAGEFERIGYADIEARESEEYIVENIECNDIRFLSNGYQIDWAIVSEEDLKCT